jgi:hypothetical protein
MATFSTGLRNSILSTGSLKSALDGGRLALYSGTMPANADAAIDAGTLMYTFTVNNDGATNLNFDTTASDGILMKAPAESWQAACVAAGDIAFFRYYLPPDDPMTASVTAVRVQGTVGTSFADLLIAEVTKALADPLTLDHFGVMVPESSY